VTDNNSWQPPTNEPVDPTAQPQPQFAPPQGVQQGVQQGPPPPQYGPPQPTFAPPQFGPPQPQYGQPQYGQPQYGEPQYGRPQYAQQQYGQPQYGQPEYGAANFGPGIPATGYAGPGVQPGWTPPPKPGLIPLRPLGFGTLLGASFQVMRRNPRPTFGVSLVLNLISYGLLTAIVATVAVDAFNRVSSASFSEQDEIFNGAIGLGALAALIPGVLFVVVTGIMQGIVSLEVARGTVGEKLRFGQLWGLAKGRIGALIGWSFLVTVVLYGAVIVVAIIVTLIAVIGGNPASIGIAILIAILAGVALIAASAFFSTKLSLVPTILMLERRSLPAAIARSWSLTNGYFWKTLGVEVLVSVIISTASQVVSTPVGFLAGIGGGLLNPTGDEQGAATLLIVVTAISTILGVLFQAITVVAVSAVTSLIYIDIRMRKEGLDLELTRFVEARQAGDSSVTNPYLSADVTSAEYAATPVVADGSPWV